MQNAQREHSAILLTFIKLSFVFKTFVLCIFERPLKTGFTIDRYLSCQNILISNLFISAALLLQSEDKLKVAPKLQQSGIQSYHWAKQMTNFNDKCETVQGRSLPKIHCKKKIK